MVEIVVQTDEGLLRQALRVEVGSSIRAVLASAGHPEVVARIEASRGGLARHGRRARLDDTVDQPTRIEAMLPITADAKAWRHRRVAERRARGRLSSVRRDPS